MPDALLGLPLPDSALEQELAVGLDAVESGLREAVASDDPFVANASRYLVEAGGKRFRPLLVLLAAQFGDPEARGVIPSGVVVELTHLATLYHDDVMDEAKTRRTVDSVNARWGNLKAILGGDFLLAKASEIAAGLGTEVAGLLAATIAKLCEGQVRELRNIYNTTRSEDSYLGAIAGKTAALFAAATRIGGLVAGLPRIDIDRLTTFGTEYGMAFQIVDDILDVVASEEELGKPSGNDLMQGVYTLPVIRSLGGPDRDRLLPLLGRPLTKTEVEQPRRLIIDNGSIAGSVATAHGYIERALEALAPLPDRPGTEALRGAAHHLLASLPATG